MGFVADKVTLGQVYFPALRFRPVSVIPPITHLSNNALRTPSPSPFIINSVFPKMELTTGTFHECDLQNTTLAIVNTNYVSVVSTTFHMALIVIILAYYLF